MKSIITFLFAVAIFMMVGCAAGPNAMEGVGTNVAGFWLGLWQGMIIGITFIVSWFTDSVSIYEVHNNGFWYNFGFWLGVGSWAGGGHAASRRKKG